MEEEELLDLMARMRPYICTGGGLLNSFQRRRISVTGEELPFDERLSCLLPFYNRYGGHFFKEPVKNRLVWYCPPYITRELLAKLVPYFKKYKMHVHIRVARGMI